MRTATHSTFQAVRANSQQLEAAERSLLVVALDIASTISDGQRLLLAREICRAAIDAFWKARTSAAGLDWPIARSADDQSRYLLSPPMERAASITGRFCAALPVDVAAYRIGSIYTALLPSGHRTRYGAFYTPPPLAGRLLDNAEAAGVDWQRASVLDPACGGGAFLVPVAQRMLRQAGPLTTSTFDEITPRLHGFELDPFAAWMSHVLTEATLLDAARLAGKRLSQSTIEIVDTVTRAETSERWDLVVGNPPFGRVTLGADARARFARSLYGHANLYGIFTDISLRAVSRDGVVALVLPTSFLAGEYFKRLRELILAQAPLLSIDFVSERKGVFAGVLQETALVTMKPKRVRARAATVSFLRSRNGEMDVFAPVASSRRPSPGRHGFCLATMPRMRSPGRCGSCRCAWLTTDTR